MFFCCRGLKVALKPDMLRKWFVTLLKMEQWEECQSETSGNIGFRLTVWKAIRNCLFSALGGHKSLDDNKSAVQREIINSLMQRLAKCQWSHHLQENVKPDNKDVNEDGSRVELLATVGFK